MNLNAIGLIMLVISILAIAVAFIYLYIKVHSNLSEINKLTEMKGSISDKFRITLTKNQMYVIIHALELYNRVGIGHLEFIVDVLQDLFRKKKVFTYEDKEYIYPLKLKLGHSTNSHFGIGQEDVDNKVKVSYDIMKSIQKVIAKVDNHHSFSVWHNGNIVKYGNEPLIIVEGDGDETKE